MSRKPNIILVMTDEERIPQHMEGVNLDEMLPARARLRKEGVSYQNFFINTSPCTPSRCGIMSGLYTQQSWVCYLIDNGQPSLRPQFPTYGKVLRDELGYNTYYFGKWHISNLDGLSEHNPNYSALDKYGFTHFWPGHEDNGKPVEGTMNDRKIANKFADFVAKKADTEEPFLSVVSLVNPHDVMYFPDKVIPEPSDPYENIRVPDNFETMEHLEKYKPKCQSKFRAYYNSFMGQMPDQIKTDQDKRKYRLYLSHYLWLQQQVDVQIQKVFDALDKNRKVRDNTILIFTSDHGDYIGSHGMRGKDCAVYDEALKVPLYVVDYTGTLIPDNQKGTARSQLGSSIDIFPTMLAMAASGEEKSRITQKYGYLPGIDLTPNISDPNHPTKDCVLFTNDSGEELGTAPGDSSPIAQEAPTHILCLIDQEYKAAAYNYWQLDIDPHPESLLPEQAVTIAGKNTELELYRRVATPHKEEKWETENLADNEKYKRIMAEYRSRIYKHAADEIRGKLPTIGGVDLQEVSETAKTRYAEKLVK